ncbi:MAG: Calx-beta domain-containing protein [Caldilineaceae bacterium]
MRNLRLATVVGFATLLTVIFFGSMTRAAQAQQFPPPGAGYLDYNYGPDVNGAGRTPTESKPESKLWWNDGFWWGSMWNPTAKQYHIYRLNWGTQTWEDTGVAIDDRSDSRGDTLWDATTKKLYVASHFAVLNPSDTNNPANYARLYRYSYNETTHTYALDAGFPVNINHDKTEALVLAKDSTGRLWITYSSRISTDPAQKYRIYVNASSGSDTSWDLNNALDLTTLSNITDTARVLVDDISAIVAFKDNGGSKVGILWSNQYNTNKTSLNFAWHLDSNTDFKTGWTLQPTLNNLGGTTPQSKANDHMNVKSLQVNSTGQVFAAIKFENQVFKPSKPNFPEIGLLARDVDGTFAYRPYSLVADNDSRPLLLINEGDPAVATDNNVDLFVSGLPQGSKICYKTLNKNLPVPPATLNSSALGSFPSGNCGTSFIVDASGVYTTFRDPSSTKQNVNNNTGIVVLASDVNGRTYAHNVMGNPPPVVTSVGPGYNAAAVSVSSIVTVTFSKAMDPATLNNSTFSVSDGITLVPGTFSYNVAARTITFTPNNPLKADTNYTVKLTNGIKDTGGLVLDAYKNAPANTAVEQWTFSTGGTTAQFAQPSYSVLENAGSAIITVTLATASTHAVSVHYAASNGTAVAPADYLATNGVLNFAAGQTKQVFSVPIVRNSTPPNLNKTVNLTLSNPNGVGLGTLVTATLTIVDVDGPPTVQFSPTSYLVNENTSKAVLNVLLSQPVTTSVTVHYTTSDGTALAGQDYAAAPDTILTFGANITQTTIEVPIVNDNTHEGDETFKVKLSNVSGGNAQLASAGAGDQASVIIKDDDPIPAVQFSSTTYTTTEGSTVDVTVNLSHPSAFPVTVNYATSDDTATQSDDYTASSGTLTFDPGQTLKTFQVSTVDDAISEGNETVKLTLSNVNSNATLDAPGDAAVLNIVDNEALPTAQFNASNYNVAENGTSATLTVQLSAPSGQPVKVRYSTSDGTATDGIDYVGVSDELIIPAGEMTKTFEVFIIDDNTAESPETVNLKLDSPTNATLGALTTATLTIVDDDSGVTPTVQFSSAAYSVNEGAGTATITVTLSAPAASPVSVNYATSSGTATDGSDYSGVTSALNFTAGQLSKTFTVPITQDTAVEGNETINLALTAPSGATLGTPATAVLTIVDDDVASGSKVFLPVVRK